MSKIEYPTRPLDIVAWAVDGFFYEYDLEDEAKTCLKYLREQGADERWMKHLLKIEERI